MNRTELEKYIHEKYNAEAAFPWVKFPLYEVFRHSNSRKWFAVVMNIPKSKLGLQSDDTLDVVNLKCEPLFISSLREETGFFPAYHMNKGTWITAALDGSVPDDKLKMLLDMSFEATCSKSKNHKQYKRDS